MGDICGDNRFEIIEKAKKNLLESTNIHTSEDEMKALDSFLFRCWQMGWLERYDKPREPLDIPTMTTDFIKEHRLPCPEGYIFKDENGNVINATKIVLEKKEKEYPKTYEECLKILGFTTIYTPKVEPIFDYDDDIIALQKLKNCRNAYWKIAGEEMGLGKPWEPDWNTSEPKYVIACTSNGVEKQWETTYCKGLAFPTAEMRDEFYDNFKELIGQCKELL